MESQYTIRRFTVGIYFMLPYTCSNILSVVSGNNESLFPTIHHATSLHCLAVLRWSLQVVFTLYWYKIWFLLHNSQLLVCGRSKWSWPVLCFSSSFECQHLWNDVSDKWICLAGVFTTTRKQQKLVLAICISFIGYEPLDRAYSRFMWAYGFVVVVGHTRCEHLALDIKTGVGILCQESYVVHDAHQQIQIHHVCLNVVPVVRLDSGKVFELRCGFRTQRFHKRSHPSNTWSHTVPRQA